VGTDDPCSPVAFVLSSGASLGAAQVGMLRALLDHGIRPDLVVGCSVGAINGAALAEDPTPAGVARLDRLWRTTDGRRIMPGGLRRTVGLARRTEAVDGTGTVQDLLAATLTATTFDELAVPFQCVATDVMAETEAWFDRGPLVEAVLASAAMPGLFPSVQIGGRRYLDGAIVDDVPVGRAAALGARTLYVLEGGALSRSWQEPRRPMGSAVQAYWIARRHRFRRALDALPDGVEVHLLPAGEVPRRRFHDFDGTGELIDAARVATGAYLGGAAGTGGAAGAATAAPAAAAGGPS
jgi:NTE family protein